MSTDSVRELSGNKYIRSTAEVHGNRRIEVDVYCVLEAFEVVCPARQHAIKKLLCSGLRKKGSVVQDLEEALDAVKRALELQVQRENCKERALPDKITKD